MLSSCLVPVGNTEGPVEVVCLSALGQQQEASASLQTAAVDPELGSDDHAAAAQQPTDKYRASNIQSWRYT